ncbi:MAG: magnesium-translocating P-type ATPase [Desulfobacterota bacterium]|nr:magnesium-translocating P-type ATPase [Thermodesulfobacteriota bacterium]MDW8001295.1 magnesium-translocating P-type ATPase [Deltaproteobacteria bacterium]
MKNTQDLRVKNRNEGILIELCRLPQEAILKRLGTRPEGLSSDEALYRLEKYGPNELSHLRRLTFYENILGRFKNPLVIQLLIIAFVSAIIGEIKSTVVVTLMLFLSVGLSFIFDDRSAKAVEALGKQVATRASVLRDGVETEIKLSEVVPGDIVILKAGSIIPADLRLIAARDFFVNEAALTGESMPVEKVVEANDLNYNSALELPNACFFGTHVVSGTAKGVVIHTGKDTLFGSISEKLLKGREETSFDKGIKSFTYMMTKVMAVLVFCVFLLVGITKGNWIQALLFGLAVAVGLTPQMLPMIITVNLAKGALSMAKKKVIVKRLPSIQNFGAMDILCTDKTGTLTQNRVVLKKHVDIIGKTSEEVLQYAYLNSYFQTGLKSLIDSTILEHVNLDVSSCKLVDELPFDFQRRRMSVVVDYEGSHVLICKGAVEEIYACCTHYQIDDHIYPLIDLIRADLFEDVEALNRDGFRVLGIAYREFPREKKTFTVEDESNLILLGYIAFYDPPKDSAIQAIRLLKERGVRIKVLTGDNGLVTKKVCEDVGLKAEKLITGGELSSLDAEAFAKAVEEYDIFVKLSPVQKEQIVRQLRANGHVVGFLGDGINDAPAMKAADVGISVDTAVDVAKESADIVLLEKSLGVLEEGIVEGRKVFANIVKYIRMGSSSNFGNMFSVVGSSYLLPFLPMQPIQVLTNNLLYDLSQTAIPTDNVDKEVVEKPLKWNIEGIRKFMMFIGPISSIFDYLTFALLWFVFGCGMYTLPGVAEEVKLASERLFQTGWFVESLLTQTLIIHVIRTKKVPIIESFPSIPLFVATLTIMAIGVYLPYSPFAESLGFVPLPPTYWLWIILFLASYCLLTHRVKVWFFKRYGGE